MNKVIAYLVSNPGSNDPRVIKMANAAALKGYKVHIFGTLKPGFEPFEKVGNITFHRFEWSPVKVFASKKVCFYH